MSMSPSDAVRTGMSALESAIADQRGKVDSLQLLKEGCQQMIRQEAEYIKAIEEQRKMIESLTGTKDARPKIKELAKPGTEAGTSESTETPQQ